jgi:hypothetical protein
MNPGRFGLLRHLSTRRVGFRQYPSTTWVGRRLHRSTRRRGFVRPPLPIRAIDAVVARQYAIFVHPLGGGQTTCSAFALLRFSGQRLFLRRRRRSILRRRRGSFLRRRLGSFLRRRRGSFLRRRCMAFLRRRRRAFLRRRRRAFLRRRHGFVFSPFAVALPKGADDNRHEHQQDYKVAEIDADARPRRLRRFAAHKIGTSGARRLGRSGN